MEPTTAIAGATVAANVISAYAQWRNSEAARRASGEEIAKMDDIINKLQQPQYDQSGIEIPALDSAIVVPEDLRLIEKFIPEVAPQIKEVKPELAQQTEGMRTGNEAQRAALQKFRDIANSPNDPALEAQLNLASRRGQAEAQSRQQSILENAQRRGQLGSGMMMGAQLAGSAQSMDRAGEQGQQAAIEAYRNRLGALRDSASLGGDIYNQDERMQNRNTDIINAFNQRTSANANNYAQYAADVRNRANQGNIQQAQNISNQNIGARNQARAHQQGAYNQAQQFGYGAKVGQQQNKNDIMSKIGQFDMNKAGLQTGMGQQRIGQIMGNAADKNAAIQGVTSGVTSGAQYYGQQSNADKNFDLKKAEYKKKYGEDYNG